MAIKQGISVGVIMTKEDPEIRQIAITVTTAGDNVQNTFSMPIQSAKDLIRLLRVAVRRIESE